MKYNPWFLLEVAESANPPDYAYEDPERFWWTNETFKAKDGWKVVFFYDAEELDYIDSFITPKGEVLKELPSFINYRKELKKTETNEVYNIIRRIRSDGYLFYGIETMSKMLLLLINQNSYNTKTEKEFGEYRGICYSVGDFSVVSEFDDPVRPVCMQQTFSLPVRAYYIK